MKGLALAGLLAPGVALVTWWSCARAPKGTTIDLLARSPDEGGSVVVDREQRRVRLDPGAEVRYRIAQRAPGQVHLTALAIGEGTLEANWFAIDLAKGTESPRGGWRIEGAWPNEAASDLPREDLVELRLAWRAQPGAGKLELSELALHESSEVERAPIVLIVIDTLSARHLSTYGYPLVTDPELVRLAAESFVFEHCFANAPWTVPSFMTLMTGLYGRAHELMPAGPNLWERWYLAQNRWTLAEALRAGGYRTAGFVDNSFLSRLLGFAQGFDVYDESAAADSFDTHDDPDGGIRRTTGLARAFLEGLEPDEPFFLFVHAFDVHSPYSARVPEEERARGTEPYDPARTAPAGGSNWTFGIVPTFVARGEVPEGELPNPMRTAPIERAYDEGVRFTDEELGRFLAWLREERILERSWVFFTADHGETMADDVHHFGHGILSQDVMHVPLVIRPPGGRPGEKRIADTVQLADLYPTLLELAGVEACGPGLQGRSLVPLLRGEKRASGAILAETGITRQAMLVADGWKLVELEPLEDSAPETRISHPLLMQRLPAQAELESRPRGSPRWLDDAELRRDFFERMPAQGLTEELLARMRTRAGYRAFQRFVDRLLRGPFYELYDLATDPEAKNDVAAQHPEKVAAMKELLEQEKRRRQQAWQLASPPAKPVELPSEEIRALQALGYGGAGGDE